MFFSAKNPNQPAMPVNVNDLPGWDLGNGQYLLDDLDGDVQANSLSGDRSKNDGDGPPSPGDGGG